MPETQSFLGFDDFGHGKSRQNGDRLFNAVYPCQLCGTRANKSPASTYCQMCALSTTDPNLFIPVKKRRMAVEAPSIKFRRRLEAYIRKNQWQTSTQISRAFNEEPGGRIHSWLWSQWKKGVLERKAGCGPRGGNGYNFALTKAQRPTWHEHLLEDRLDD